MGFSFTLWELLPIAAWLGLTYAGPALLAVAVLLLAVPGLRRHAGTRRTAYGLLGVLVLLAVGASPFLAWRLDEWRRHRAWDALTRHLDAPQVFGGVAFPAGSAVHVAESGVPQFGSLPVPTPVLGLPLVGDFVLDVAYDVEKGDHLVGVTGGTLAAPTDVQGIPCGPGPIVLKEGITRCVLARDWVFAGHPLAGGTALEVDQFSRDDPPVLRFGSLARAELLYDVRWPPGTVLGQVDRPPERMAHGNGPESLLVEICLPSGATAEIPGVAVLHGLLAFGVQEGRRRLSRVCLAGPDGQVGDGYAQVGPDRFADGERADARSAWLWGGPLEPGE